jgi:hypothetical protein
MNDAATTTVAPATTGRLVARAALAPAELDAMHALLASHFEGVSAAQFRADLAEKNWAVLIERGGRLVGFTTILAYESQVDGEPVSVVYSGDTIVAPEAWNSATLPRAWIEAVTALRRHYSRGRYVWLLITSGFRTYRFLPVFWREFWPRFDAATPDDWGRLRDRLAEERFGERYDARTGVVRLASPQRLRGELASVPAGRAAADPHVAFFMNANPGHDRGDELVCVTELTPANLTAAGRRMTAGLRPW